MLYIEDCVYLASAFVCNGGRGSPVGIATRYGLDTPGIESRWGARFSVPIQTGPGAHPASCTVVTGSFPGLKRLGSGADPHPHLQCWGLKLGRSIPLPALRALVACIGRIFTFTFVCNKIFTRAVHPGQGLMSFVTNLPDISSF